MSRDAVLPYSNRESQKLYSPLYTKIETLKGIICYCIATEINYKSEILTCVACFVLPCCWRCPLSVRESSPIRITQSERKEVGHLIEKCRRALSNRQEGIDNDYVKWATLVLGGTKVLLRWKRCMSFGRSWGFSGGGRFWKNGY